MAEKLKEVVEEEQLCQLAQESRKVSPCPGTLPGYLSLPQFHTICVLEN